MPVQLAAALVSAALVAAPVPASTKPATAEATTATPPAASDDKLKRAEELFNNGRQLFKEGSYEAAILAFQESYDLSKLPEILYNIGNSYEKLGDFANARKYLDQYRAFAPEKERELLGRRIQNLDQRLREQEDRARAAMRRSAKPIPLASRSRRKCRSGQWKCSTRMRRRACSSQPRELRPSTTSTPSRSTCW